MRSKNTWTTTEVDNALCIFEWLMSTVDEQKHVCDGQFTLGAKIVKMFSDYGWSGMRHVCMQAALICEDVYRHAKGPNDEPEHFDSFDWEFVPAFCRVLDWDRLAENNQLGDQLWRSDAPKLWATMVAARALRAA